METPEMKVLNQDNNSKISGVLERNIETLLRVRKQKERKKDVGNRVADRITNFLGSMPFIYIHLIGFGGWVALNVGSAPLFPFDPELILLATFASVEAIFLSTFVLITQNRMAAEADKRADLDLHMSLLAEHEITRLISMVNAIAQKMNVELMQDSELRELEKQVIPEQVLDKIEETHKQLHQTSVSTPQT